MRRASPRIWILMLFAVAAMAGFASAGSVSFNETVDAGSAGEGDGVISGYNATEIHYTLLSPFPEKVTAVTFRLDSPATEVYARFQLSPSGQSDWEACDPFSSPPFPSNTWSCTGFFEDTKAVIGLEVAAAE